MVEHLPSKHKALNSNLSTEKKPKKTKPKNPPQTPKFNVLISKTYDRSISDY
jgi:hypothetical protein